MKLFIDTSNFEKITIRLDGNEVVEPATREKSQLLLPLVDRELKKMGKTVRDLKNIEVITGPGSFTGIRVGIAIANTLGWLLNIPVNGKKEPVEPTY